jgi:FSR family fosmidomycin resistance protein-like MFS transporter
LGFNFGSGSFTLLYANLFWTEYYQVIGIVIASAFSAILVFAQELMPGKVGMISGLFFWFCFWNGRFGVCAFGLSG